jgi:hypothetical protein
MMQIPRRHRDIGPEGARQLRRMRPQDEKPREEAAIAFTCAALGRTGLAPGAERR